MVTGRFLFPLRALFLWVTSSYSLGLALIDKFGATQFSHPVYDESISIINSAIPKSRIETKETINITAVQNDLNLDTLA
jgi:hypothetical protein